MKNLILFLSIITLSSFMLNVNEDDFSVGDACVGECGQMIDHIIYQVPVGEGDCAVPFCVSVTEFSLCPNHNAEVHIYINGVPWAVGLISSTSDVFSFEANCGDNVRVTLQAVPNGNPVSCKRLGNARIELNTGFCG